MFIGSEVVDRYKELFVKYGKLNKIAFINPKISQIPSNLFFIFSAKDNPLIGFISVRMLSMLHVDIL